MATPVRMPLMGITMEEGILSRWLVEEGTEVTNGQTILEFETDKISAELEAPADGILGGIVAREGDAVKVQGLLAYILEPGEEPPAADAEAAPPEKTAAAAPEPAPPTGAPAAAAATAPVPAVPAAAPPAALSAVGPVKSSPLARKVARELGVDLGRVSGTGPGGRIVEEDVRATAAAPAAAPVTEVPALGRPAPGEPPAGSTIPLVGVRRVIAERMQQSLRDSAQLTLVTEADATRFHELRTELAAQYEPTLGFRLSYNDLLIRICARALQEHPRVNSTLAGEEIRLLDFVNIGLAVEAGQHLVVINVRHPERKSLMEIATEVRDKVERARSDQLGLDDITGGTFTITNLGQYGVDAFTPIINPPEAAILGVGQIREKPVIVGGQVVPRMSMTLSLTLDHRIVDGAAAARFLQRVRELVERPYVVLI